MALTNKLTAIADGFRASRGTTDKYTLDQMAVLAAEPTGGSGDNEPTDEELTITGDCTYRFANNGWNWLIEKYGDRITTKDISLAMNMFSGSSSLETIPFQINVNNCTNFSYLLHNSGFRTVPKVRGNVLWNTSTNFSNATTSCIYLRDMEDLFTPEMIEGFSTVKVTSSYTCSKPPIFQSCSSLRTIPSWWYKFRLNENSTAFPSNSYSVYYYSLYDCSSVDEINNIPVWKCAAAQTSNMFSNTFSYCNRLKNVTFETNTDGTPIQAQWKSQTIDLSTYVGYSYSSDSQSTFSTDVKKRQSFVDTHCFNSGITEDKLIYNDETYQLLKDDSDSFAVDCGTSTGGGIYSRYNYDSAVATINSLPDTSAYLATAGGTNTIKFKGTSGSSTDGGAINTLTEEEIAVATAKGWTVTYA